MDIPTHLLDRLPSLFTIEDCKSTFGFDMDLRAWVQVPHFRKWAGMSPHYQRPLINSKRDQDF